MVGIIGQSRPVMYQCKTGCENDYFLQINVIFKVSLNGTGPFMSDRGGWSFMYFMVSNKGLMEGGKIAHL